MSNHPLGVTTQPYSKEDRSTLLITGCSSGIGLSVATGLKARGYSVYAAARKQADVERLKCEGFNAVQLDYTDSESIRHALREVLSMSGGKLYGLFNNGAYGQPGAVEDLSRDALKAQFETNLFGWHELTSLVIPVMRQQGYGRIIQNSSILGFVPMRYRGAYNASKFALEGLTDTLRMELKGSGIFVSSIQPGPIESRFRANALEMFLQNIDPSQSYHEDVYIRVLDRLKGKTGRDPFTLPPTAVLKRVVHILESRKPRSHYPVTVPTYFFGLVKRLLPISVVHSMLRRVS